MKTYQEMTDKEQRVIDTLQALWFDLHNNRRKNTEEDEKRLLYEILVLNDKAIRMGIQDGIETGLITCLKEYLVDD